MPITLPVRAEADDRSFGRVADAAEKRFVKAGADAGKAFGRGLDDAAGKAGPAADRWVRAYDKVADATGKVRVEEAKLADMRERGASNTRLIAQAENLERARRAEIRATRDAANAYQDLGARAGALGSTLTSLASGTRFGGLIADTQVLAGTFGGVGLAVGGAITAVAGLAVGIGAAGKALYDLGAQWDDVADGITARTGLMGDELNAVMEQVTEVGLATGASFSELGEIAAQTAALMGSSGDQVGELMAYISGLNELTGQSTNIRQLAMFYRVFGVEADKQVDTLNQLYGAFTTTQIPVNDLIGMLVKAGPTFKQFGLDAGQTAGMLAQFTEAGVDPEKAITGLTKGLKAAADAGQDPQRMLTDVIAKIKELHAAGNDVAARQLAVDFFGAKNAAPFLEAITSGKLAVDQLNTSLQKTDVDILEVLESTSDLDREWKRFKNFLESELQPAAAWVFDKVNWGLEALTSNMRYYIDQLKEAWDWVQRLNPFAPIDSSPQGYNNGVPGVPWTPGFLDSAPATGGDPLNPGGIYGPNVRGTPGQGLPMPWTLPPLGSGGKSLAFDGQITGQKFSWDCAPGSAEIILNGAGVIKSEESLIAEMGTTTAGTNFGGGNISGTLNRSLPGANYQEVQGASAAQLFADISRSIGSGYGAMLNWNTSAGGPVPKGIKGTTATPYSGGIAHYVAAMGVDHVDQSILIADPKDGRQYWITAENAAALSRNRGYVAANPSPGAAVLSSTRTWSQPPGTPSPDFGPDYRSGPAGSTPGVNDMGDPGYYVPDPRQIRTAERRVEDTKTAIGESNDAILDAQNRQRDAIIKAAEIQEDLTATDEQKASAQRQLESANKALEQAVKRRDRLVEDLGEANENLAEARRGQFRSAQRMPKAATAPGVGSSSSGSGFSAAGGQSIGAPVAGDFGASGGLPGLAENLTNFLGNMAAAPLLGPLAMLGSSLDPTGRAQGGGGLLGMAGAMMSPGVGGSSLTMGSTAPGMLASFGAGGAGGGIGSALSGLTGVGGQPAGMAAQPPVGVGGMFGAPTGAPPGPAAGAASSTLGGTSPSAGTGGAGFGGMGGIPMQGIQAGIGAAGMALDAMAPGAGTAAAMAANTTVQLANRAIGQAGKAVGLTVGGIMETLLPANSTLGDPNANWFGKIAAGFAGAKPALPNMTGQPADKPAGQTDPAADPAKNTGGGGINVEYHNHQATEDRAGADLTNHLQAMNTAPGMV